MFIVMLDILCVITRGQIYCSIDFSGVALAYAHGEFGSVVLYLVTACVRLMVFLHVSREE